MGRPKTSLSKEKDVKREIRKILDRINIWYYMPPASVYGRRGIPDFVCCLHGAFVGIEAKSPKMKKDGLSPTQLLESRGIMKNGGEYIVVWDKESLEKLVDRLHELSLELTTKGEHL